MANIFNVLDTVQSQYSSSPRMIALLSGFASLIDPRPDIDLLFRSYFDIDSARGDGLDNWGRIVDFGRIQQNITLTDDEYRSFIKIKMASNISGVTLNDLNVILNKVFAGRGSAYVLEVGVMRIRYIFSFDLTPLEQELFNNEAILPRPGCVGFEVGDTRLIDVFGFNGQDLMNFDNGYFG